MRLLPGKYFGPMAVLLLAGLIPMKLSAQDSLQKLSVPLNSGWEFRQILPAVPAETAPPATSGTSTATTGAPRPTTAATVPANGAPTPEWHPATVPGDVHL